MRLSAITEQRTESSRK